MSKITYVAQVTIVNVPFNFGHDVLSIPATVRMEAEAESEQQARQLIRQQVEEQNNEGLEMRQSADLPYCITRILDIQFIGGRF